LIVDPNAFLYSARFIISKLKVSVYIFNVFVVKRHK
jgi:hypothetical protein